MRSFRFLAAQAAVALASFLMLSTWAPPASAVPSFARQTGASCAACHVGAFGPQLTDFGVQFKLSGYTMSRNEEFSWPLAAMIIGSASRTRKAQPDPLPDHVRANNNVDLDQVSLFLSGRLSDHVGIFSQLTHDGIGHGTALDMVDLRYARSVQIGSHGVLAGLSLNNTPGASDPYNALPNWGYPYVSSAVVPTPAVGTLLDGALAQRVVGLAAYAQVDGRWYGELGSYRTLSSTAQARLGLGRDGDPGPLHGTLYGRLASHGNWGDHGLAGGVTVFRTGIQADRGAPDQNRYKDLALDASYRWSTGPGVFTLLGNVIHERQRRDALVVAGAAAQSSGSLRSHSLTAAYHWSDYGLTVQHFGLSGSADALLYADGFAQSRPNSSGLRLQADWTPFGKRPVNDGFDPQWRLGLQYTAYNSFNGARLDYDGAGRNARDNNSLFAFVWLLF